MIDSTFLDRGYGKIRLELQVRPNTSLGSRKIEGLVQHNFQKRHVLQPLSGNVPALNFVSPPVGVTVKTWRVSGAGTGAANGT